MYNQAYGCGPMGWRQLGGHKAAPVNITETNDAYVINLYAPALRKEAISITTQNDILTIRYQGEKEATAPYTLHEYRTEEINRSFDLKGKVVIDRIKAAYTEGILKIELPKTEAAKQTAQPVAVH